MKHASGSVKQSFQANGNIKTLTKVKWPKAYTLTVWESREAMFAYRNSGAHKEAMRIIPKVSSAFRSIHWESEDMPAWHEAFEKLNAVELVMLRK